MSTDQGRWIKVEALGFLPDGVELPTDMLELYAAIGRAFRFHSRR